MSIRPLHDGLIVQLDPQPRQVGMIHLPDSKEPRVMTGVVQRVGRGRHYVDGVYIPAELKEGDRIAFLTAVKDGSIFRAVSKKLEEGQVLMDHRDVLFVIEGDKIPDLG